MKWNAITKIMKNKLKVMIVLIAFGSLFISSTICAQTDRPETTDKELSSQTNKSLQTEDIDKIKADDAWKNIGRATEPAEPINGASTYTEALQKWGGSKSPKVRTWLNRSKLRFREEGLKFWKRFPNDPRRFQWLQGTMWMGPNYWADWENAVRLRDPYAAPIDKEAQKAWDNIYVVMRAQFMSSQNVTDKARNEFRSLELLPNFWRHRAFASSRGEKPDVTLFATQLLDLAPEVTNRWVVDGASNLLDAMADEPKTEAAFIEAMKLSPNVDLQLFAAGREQVAKLRSKPLDLTVTTMAGDEIEVARLRGKAVLVYIWSNWCASCMERMPGIQAMYDKYRDRGFEVVGVWLAFDEMKEKQQAQEYLNEKGATWPNGVIAGEAQAHFRKHYSIIGDPTSFLLDKNGLLVTNDVNGPKLEQEVKRLLGL